MNPYNDIFNGIVEDAEPMNLNEEQLVMELSNEQETEIFFQNSVRIGSTLYVCIHESNCFAQAYVHCPEDCVIGQGRQKFYVFQKI